MLIQFLKIMNSLLYFSFKWNLYLSERAFDLSELCLICHCLISSITASDCFNTLLESLQYRLFSISNLLPFCISHSLLLSIFSLSRIIQLSFFSIAPLLFSFGQFFSLRLKHKKFSHWQRTSLYYF